MIEIVEVPGYTGAWQVLTRRSRYPGWCRLCGDRCDLVTLQALGDDRRMARGACGLVPVAQIDDAHDARMPAAWRVEEE